MKKILMIFAITTILAGCSADIDVAGDNSKIDLTVNSVAFDVSGAVVGESNAVTIKSSSDWTIVYKEGWCTPSVSHGKSGDTVTFTVSESNIGGAQREMTFAFVCGNKTSKLQVVQAGGEQLEPLSYVYHIGVSGGNIKIPVLAGGEFTREIATEDTSWIKDVTVASGDLNVLRFDISATSIYKSRIGHITLKRTGAKDAVVEIIQEKITDVVIDKKLYEVEASGTTLTVDLKTNAVYSIVIPNEYKRWISLVGSELDKNDELTGLALYKVNFKIEPAELLRAGKVSFDIGSKKIDIEVKQGGNTHKYINISDEGFINALENLGYIVESTNGYELTENGFYATNMDVSGNSIVSLVGIEQFSNITTLYCNSNDIVNLDLSKCTNLTTLRCTSNPYKEINLGAIPVKTVSFDSYYGFSNGWGSPASTNCKIIGSVVSEIRIPNNDLDVLDVSECPALKTLYCPGSQWGGRINKIIMSNAHKDVVELNAPSSTVIEYK